MSAVVQRREQRVQDPTPERVTGAHDDLHFRFCGASCEVGRRVRETCSPNSNPSVASVSEAGHERDYCAPCRECNYLHQNLTRNSALLPGMPRAAKRKNKGPAGVQGLKIGGYPCCRTIEHPGGELSNQNRPTTAQPRPAK